MKKENREKELQKLDKKIIRCKKCPRLNSYIKDIAKKKVKRYSNERYCGKPLPGFGDINAEILIIGLAPAAHGGNRTGRMFTGDSSGDWVAKVLFENKFASKPTSQSLDDGFFLKNAYITAAVRCAPPENKPTRDEFENCFEYLEQELVILEKIKVIVCLGKIAFDSCCKLLKIKGEKFYHGNVISHEKYKIICSYHPSRQNTQTGRLVWKKWNEIFAKAEKLINK